MNNATMTTYGEEASELAQWIAQLRALDEARRVRWSLDIDPMDLY